MYKKFNKDNWYNIFNTNYNFVHYDIDKKNWFFESLISKKSLLMTDCTECIDNKTGQYHLFGYFLPYDVLKNCYKTGDKVWTDTHGEVKFICCEHNIIKCLADNEIEVFFTYYGKPCWWSDEYNCYRFDDETKCAIWPNKGIKYWRTEIKEIFFDEKILNS